MHACAFILMWFLSKFINVLQYLLYQSISVNAKHQEEVSAAHVTRQPGEEMLKHRMIKHDNPIKILIKSEMFPPIVCPSFPLFLCFSLHLQHIYGLTALHSSDFSHMNEKKGTGNPKLTHYETHNAELVFTYNPAQKKITDRKK